jgi:6-pyruvoyltetrahydropterin/6-carboxytetrahydropterin synthase
MYYSTKKFGPISTGHRQWRAAEIRDSSRCAWAHGYGRYVELTFAASELDARGWVVDFGGLRNVKSFLDHEWDHRLLLSSDDPLLAEFLALDKLGGCNVNVMDVTKGWGPGIEQSCKFVYDHIEPLITKQTEGRCTIAKVQIWEHEKNTAIYKPGAK